MSSDKEVEFEKCIPIPDTLIAKRWEEVPHTQLTKCKVHDTIFNPEVQQCRTI
jgi:hypothetical protein